MIELDVSRFKTKPFEHQIEATKALLRNSAFAIFSEMGTGKTKSVIDAACTLAAAGEINTVVVVCPASVRSVWCDEELGEIKKHSWQHNRVVEFALGKLKERWTDTDCATKIWLGMQWVLTNYEILRNEKHLAFLIGQLKLGECKTMLVLDESSYIKNRTAKQTKAVKKLRAMCQRCVLLNGTPVVNNPLDLWSQMQVLLHPNGSHLRNGGQYGIHDANYFRFRARYAVLGGWHSKQVIQWQNLDELTKSVTPYVLRRLKKDCLDLPEKLYTQREVALTEDSWKRYKQLRDEAVIALSGNDSLRLEPHAAVRVMRLAQLTSGHLGSVTPTGEPEHDCKVPVAPFLKNIPDTSDLSSEKIDWCVQYLTEECQARYVIVWCRWRRERERLWEILVKQYANRFEVYQIYGGQPKSLREDAIKDFSGQAPERPYTTICIAQPHAGGLGLNLVAATEVIYLSNDWSYGVRLQSEDRCHRPGQKHPVTYIDVVATGPQGQKTVDHTVLKALRNKQDLAALTSGAWVKELASEA